MLLGAGSDKEWSVKTEYSSPISKSFVSDKVVANTKWVMTSHVLICPSQSLKNTVQTIFSLEKLPYLGILSYLCSVKVQIFSQNENNL